MLVIPDRTAYLGDQVGQVRLDHKRFRPELFENLLFGNDAPALSNQKDQQVQRLPGQMNRIFLARQLSRVGIENVFVENISHRAEVALILDLSDSTPGCSGAPVGLCAEVSELSDTTRGGPVPARASTQNL